MGLNLGAVIAVTAFSLTGAATGLATCSRIAGIRTVFGVSAAAGLPLSGKANAMYLEPQREGVRHGDEPDRDQPGRTRWRH